MSFEIKGLDQLKEKLSQMEKKIANDISKKALEEAATPVENAQRRLSPVKTGELRANLKKQNITKKKGASVIKIGIDKSASQDVKNRAYYNNWGANGRAGTFFMQESFEQSKEEALNIIKRVLKEELK